MQLQVIVVCHFSLLSSVSIPECTPAYLLILLLMDIWTVFSLGLLRIDVMNILMPVFIRWASGGLVGQRSSTLRALVGTITRFLNVRINVGSHP